jgi:hypothetical protein
MPGLSEIRAKRLKEIEMWNTIKAFAFYCLYISIMVIIGYNNRDPNAGLLRQNMENVFINPIKLNQTDRYPQVSFVHFAIPTQRLSTFM